MGGPGAFGKYWTWWGRLLFQEPKHALMVSSPVIGLTVGGFFLAGWGIWKSLRYDPEVRFRPHKKAWHFPEERAQNVLKYRHGLFAWYYKMVMPERWRYEQAKLENAFEDDLLKIPPDDD